MFRGIKSKRQGVTLKGVVLALALVTLTWKQAVTQATAGQQEGPTAAPTLPHLDWKACPFEGCQYGDWTARKPVAVYDTWEQKRHVVARVATGEKVTAITGLVVTYEPGIVRMDRDLPDFGLHRGDAILTYADRGEGSFAVWFKGRFDPDFDISFAKWPDGAGCSGNQCAATYVSLGKKSWWAQVKLKSGRTGWVNMDDHTRFDGIDALA